MLGVLLVFIGPFVAGLLFKWWALPIVGVLGGVLAANYEWCKPGEYCDESTAYYALPVLAFAVLFTFGGAVLRVGWDSGPRRAD